jgi:hypothetical protein
MRLDPDEGSSLFFLGGIRRFFFFFFEKLNEAVGKTKDTFLAVLQ